MSRRALFPALILLALGAGRAYAVDPGLEASTSAVVDKTVTVDVRNTDAEAATARIVLTVQLNDGSEQTLVSSNVTVEAGASASVTLSASGTIVAIGDDPEPVPPTP